MLVPFTGVTEISVFSLPWEKLKTLTQISNNICEIRSCKVLCSVLNYVLRISCCCKAYFHYSCFSDTEYSLISKTAVCVVLPFFSVLVEKLTCFMTQGED